MTTLIGLSLLSALLLAVLLPLLFAELMLESLDKLHLDGTAAALLVLAVILGGFVNIPVRRIQHLGRFAMHPLAAYGLFELWPQLQSVTQETVVAVNLGGCVIPVAIAVYETGCVISDDPRLVPMLGLAVLMSIFVCAAMARPVPGIGITLPSLVPALVSAAGAMLLAPDQAPPVAFVAGVLGPLVGADLLHLRNLEAIPCGMISIGGAGTFDGIVLSGIIAAYLA